MNVKLSLRRKFRNSYLNNKIDATALDCGSENDDTMENSEPSPKNENFNAAAMNDSSTKPIEDIMQKEKTVSATAVRRKKHFIYYFSSITPALSLGTINFFSEDTKERFRFGRRN